MNFCRIFLVNQKIFHPIFPTGRQSLGVVPEQSLQSAVRVVQPLLHHIGPGLDFRIMAADVPLAHYQTAAADLGPVFGREILCPVEGNIAALHNQVLPVFDGGLYHLPHHRPEITGQSLVAAGGGQIGVPAPDQPHFQVVDGKIGVVVFLQEPLGQGGFPGVGCPCNQNNHGGTSRRCWWWMDSSMIPCTAPD